MNFFKNRKKAETPGTDGNGDHNRKSAFTCCEFDRSSWFLVFSACLGKVMAVQDACRELVVKDRDWNVDFSRGVIAFGTDEYPLQFLGSEASSSNTWLWGWENVNGFPEEILQTANKVRAAGEEWRLEPLTTAEFELTDCFNGHSLSIVACGLAEHCCYYRGPHSGGAVLVAFSGVPEEVFAPVTEQKFVALTMQCIQQFSVDHKLFVGSFLLWNGTPYEWQDLTVTAHFKDDLIIEYEIVDSFWRIKCMKNTGRM